MPVVSPQFDDDSETLDWADTCAPSRRKSKAHTPVSLRPAAAQNKAERLAMSTLITLEQVVSFQI